MKTRTKRRTIIEHSQFRQMLSYKPFVTLQSDKQTVKNDLKQDIVNLYQDKWYRLKEGTRAAIDFLCYSACELGFSYASQEYLSKWGVSERTIRRIMNDLQKTGIIFIAFRRKGAFNCCGKPVYFFTKHQYFAYWRSFLGIDAQSSNLLDSQVETPEIPITKPILTADPFSNSILTSNLSKESVKDRSKDEESPIGSDIDYLPHYIDRTFGIIYKVHFGLNIERINSLWSILKQQAYKANIELENVSQAGIWSLKQLIGQMKIKKIKNINAYFTQIVKEKCHEIFLNECEDEYGADFSKLEFVIPH
ncbi:hypothetical protein OYT88_02280 [Sporolactobacillus sp. CQH2019]|uniref:hypothetical protein n=1 Tax=Sporolactobacillus sp. CQH2019 TaxID=3023512 RepID=UPI0023687ECB|nr:hypothetical protein [Sporolactobacillus sp. CQH2019]MDD9147377.1 hypothetical protein [Sporolactobacillus sp. CQH2019]